MFDDCVAHMQATEARCPAKDMIGTPRPLPAGLVSTGIAFAAAAGLLLGISERIGAPAAVAQAGGSLALALLVLGLGWSVASLRLADLLGAAAALSPGQGGLILLLLISAGAGFVFAGGPAELWRAGAVAALLALVLNVLFAPPPDQAGQTFASRVGWRFGPWLDIPAAVAVAGLGIVLLVSGLDRAAGAVARLSGQSAGTAVLCLGAGLILVFVAGGARSACATLVALAVILLAATLLPVAFAALPLGWESLAGLVRVEPWPSVAAFGVAAAGSERGMTVPTLPEIAGLALMLALLPVLIPIGSGRGTRLPAALGAGIGGLGLVLALAAFAALGPMAMSRLAVGTSPERPPPGLVAAAAAGVVRVCGEAPATPEAMAAACARRPVRGPLRPDDIGPTERFAAEGLPFMLGLPSVAALPARALPLWLGMGAALAGLMLVSGAIGHDLLYRRLRPRALTSWRAAMVRLTAIVAVIGAVTALAVARDVVVPAFDRVTPQFAGIVAVFAVTLAALARWRRAGPLAAGTAVALGLALVASLLFSRPEGGTTLAVAADVALATTVALLAGTLVSLVTPSAGSKQLHAAPRHPQRIGDVAQDEARQQPQERQRTPALDGPDHEPHQDEPRIEVEQGHQTPGIGGDAVEAHPEIGRADRPDDGGDQPEGDEKTKGAKHDATPVVT